MSQHSKSYAEQISKAQVMKSAVDANYERLKRRGITPGFSLRIDLTTKNAIAKNNEQEKLKADLKTCTAELDALLKKLEGLMREAIKVVKLEIPQSQWKEFGITDKR